MIKISTPVRRLILVDFAEFIADIYFSVKNYVEIFSIKQANPADGSVTKDITRMFDYGINSIIKYFRGIFNYKNCTDKELKSILSFFLNFTKRKLISLREKNPENTNQNILLPSNGLFNRKKNRNTADDVLTLIFEKQIFLDFFLKGKAGKEKIG